MTLGQIITRHQPGYIVACFKTEQMQQFQPMYPEQLLTISDRFFLPTTDFTSTSFCQRQILPAPVFISDSICPETDRPIKGVQPVLFFFGRCQILSSDIFQVMTFYPTTIILESELYLIQCIFLPRKFLFNGIFGPENVLFFSIIISLVKFECEPNLGTG